MSGAFVLKAPAAALQPLVTAPERLPEAAPPSCAHPGLPAATWRSRPSRPRLLERRMQAYSAATAGAPHRMFLGKMSCRCFAPPP